MRSILCPVDFSSDSTAAALYGAALAADMQARLNLVYCYERIPLFEDTPMSAVREAELQFRSMSEARLKRLLNRLKRENPGLMAETSIAEGPAGTRIPEIASESGADLVIIGSTGSGKMKRVMMGSTAARVIRDAPCAVLTVPKEAVYKGLRRIVYATDLHDDNLRAAATVLPFARHHDAELAFVFVDDRHLLHEDEKVTAIARRIRNRIRYPKLSGYIAKDTDVVKGLGSFLKKYPAGMLVMFTHQRHFPETLLHQSVTRLVSHRLRVPLLSLNHSDRPVF
jgi:nucleotide-binding universal stress UspA family protein